MNRNFYQNARKRCMPMGTNIVTDADIILMQEEEIERYREKIRFLEEKLHKKTVRIGDEITVECSDGNITFKLLECVVHMGAWTKGNVELCGVTKIGEEIDRLAKAMKDKPLIKWYRFNIEDLSE